ncbi:hypothetical protein BJY04DRAFT_98149 [Aspergillus karnatakaensis]|uniref:uncharacterized protein n=1 Tax=Aspergillus karnatakaensis TaxID=1810916 RepID=UPI003CCC9F6A
MSKVEGKGATPSGNQPTTSTRGGASAYPTPANNSGGGAGWGDSGILKGGLEGVSKTLSSGSGESHTGKLSSLTGELSSLKDQKAAGEQRYQDDVNEAGGVPATASEDASFMNRKPGGSDTLPGWEQAKGAVNSVIGGSE